MNHRRVRKEPRGAAGLSSWREGLWGFERSRGSSAAERRGASGDRRSPRRRQPKRDRPEQRPQVGQPPPTSASGADAGLARPPVGMELLGGVFEGEGGVHGSDTHPPSGRPPCCERSVTQPGIGGAYGPPLENI